MAIEKVQDLQAELRASYLPLFDQLDEQVDQTDVTQCAVWRNERNDAIVKVDHQFARFGGRAMLPRVAVLHELSLVLEHDGGYGFTQMAIAYRSGRIIAVARGMDRASADISYMPGFPVPRINRPLESDYKLATREFQRGQVFAR